MDALSYVRSQCSLFNNCFKVHSIFNSAYLTVLPQ